MSVPRRATVRSLVAVAAAASFAAAAVLTAHPAVGRRVQGGAAALVPVVGHAAGFAVSAPVSEIAEQASAIVDVPSHGTSPVRPLPQVPRPAARTHAGDDALQTFAPPLIPVPALSFDGLSSQDDQTFFGGRLSPPDTNGDVGPNHYVQTVNVLVRVFDKTGAPLTSPFKMSSLFASLGGICSTTDAGDPIVLYDPLADRWLLSQFAFNTSTLAPPYHQCIAISQTPSPTGAFFLYDFVMPNNNFNDYPHLGVWADGYYMTDNQFLNFGPFNGAGAFAFDRAKMLAGNPAASFIYFDLGITFGGMLPADVDGKTPPPAGAPNYFGKLESTELGLPDDAPAAPIDGMRLFAFHADFVTPSASTFTELPESPIAVAAFDPLSPAGRNDIEQPSPAVTTNYLDAIQDRLMHRLAYRNFGGARESLVVTHTVNVGVDASTPATHQAAIRYYEFRRALPGGAFTVPEQATFAPDTDNRWMGSAAMDGQGNIAVGFSASSLTTFPSVRYAGRLATDPPNGLFQGEGVLAIGTGVQRSTGGRWGDYSALSVDPADDCTFWYTNEYYTAASQASSTVGWLTRIGTFKFPGCGPQIPLGTITGKITDLVTGAPIPGTVMIFSPGGSAVVTNENGVYKATIPPGTYALTASAPNHALQSVFGLVVTDGSSKTLNFSLSLLANKGVLSGVVRNATTGAPIAGTQVTSGTVASTTDGNGVYVLNLTAGAHTVSVVPSQYYLGTTASVTITNQHLTSRDFALSLPAGTGFLGGHIRDAATSAPVPDVVVSAGGVSVTTDDSGSYLLLLPVATYTVTATANNYFDGTASAVGVSNQLTTTRDLTIQAVTFAPAAYDATLKAPRCAPAGAACASGTLLVGRDSLSGGAEPNQPNTILNSCADGTTGTFHLSQSLDSLEVYTLDGGAFASGKSVRIQATVWSIAPSDRLDIYYTSTASSPVWTLLTTLAPIGPGVQTLTATYVLPAGSLQAVRGNYRSGGTAGACTTGVNDDRDDLIFGTASLAGQVTDLVSGAAISAATVSVTPGGLTAVTDTSGNYSASVAAGTYTVTASASGHTAQAAAGVVVASSGTTTVNFALALSANTGVITGHVLSTLTSLPIANAVVSAGGSTTPGLTNAAGAYSLFVAPGTYTVTASATDFADQAVAGVVVSNQSTTTRDFSLQSTAAAYSATLKAPVCALAASSCQSAGLLLGADSMVGGPEPNQPNTLFNSCADGTLGFFHSDESVDLIRISSLDGGTITAGKAVRIDTTVWVFSPVVDTLELYSAPNANSPTWTLIGTLLPTVVGQQTLSTAFILPAGSLQAVRARFRDSTFTSSLTPCGGTTLSYDDTDDLVFTVAAGNSPAEHGAAASVAMEETAASLAAAIAPATSPLSIGVPVISVNVPAMPHGTPRWAAPVAAVASTHRQVVASVNFAGLPPPNPADSSGVSAAAAGAVNDSATPPGGPPSSTIVAAPIQPAAVAPSAQRVPRAAPTPVVKKPRQHKWEIEFLAGGVLTAGTTGGKSALPAAGQAFTTTNGGSSRLESSWFFGDGASLLNQVNGALGVTPRLTPLDAVLNAAMAERQNGHGFGVRVSRAITPRLTVEVMLASGSKLGTSRAAAAGIEASRASFVSAWNGMFASGPFNSSSVTSISATVRAGHQFFATGAVNVALRTRGKAIPYVTAGGGINSILGGTPTTTMVGTYRFLFNGQTQISEIDSVTVRHTAARSFVGVVGGGVKYSLSKWWGVRLDARAYLGAHGFDNLLDAKPSALTASVAGSVTSATSPAVQFGNTPTTGILSSLSGPTVVRFRSFTGGLQAQMTIVAGIFFRF